MTTSRFKVIACNPNTIREMKIAPLPEDEAARLEALRLFKILDTNPEQAFDDLTRLAAQVCGTPIAGVSFVDDRRQWFKSKVGLEVSQVPRELAFCAHTILQSDLMIVADTLLDSRFATNPLVTGEPNIRFYAGAPLISAEGYALGTLCVIDHIPRELSCEQIEGLKALARQVIMQLELRRNLDNLVSVMRQRQDTAIALQQSEERFRNLVETSSDWMWELDENFVCRYASPKVYDLLGYKSEELIGKSPFDFMPPEEVRRVAEIITPISISRQPYTCLENTHIHKDGRLVVLEVSGVPVFDQEGRFCGYRGMARDITQRRHAEKAMRESEERFRQLAENIHQVFWMSSLDSSQMLYISPAYEKIWGKSCASLYEKPSSWMDIIHPDDQARITAAQEGLLLGDYDEEYRIIKPNGSVRWIRSRAFLVFNEAGQVYRFAGIAEDITRRKQAEEEIRFLQSIKQAIFESVDFHAALKVALQKVCESTSWDFGEAWIPRPDGTALECSRAWYSRVDSLERFRREGEGMTFPPGTGLPGRVWVLKQPEWRQDVSSDSSQVYLRAQLAAECGLKAALGIPIVANDDVVAVLVFYMFESRDEDKRLIELISASTELGLFIQRKQVEEEIKKSLEKEKELGELKSRFVSMTSHEFRTPLTAISLSAGLLANYDYKWTSEKKLNHLHRIQSAVQRMTQMLEAILLVGKADADKLEFKVAPIDLPVFCSELVAEMQLTAGARHTLSFASMGQCHSACMDEKLLHHIFTNLLSNAIKYSPKGGTVVCELICDNGEATFRVRDQGIGIPKEDIPRLFETFHRATNVGSIPGTGLGLTIIKKFVDLHGGAITVDSQVEVGTTFTVKLPLHSNC